MIPPLGTACCTRAGVFAPSINNLDTITNYNNALAGAITAQINVMNSVNAAHDTNAALQAGHGA
jgi:hypothetical protein